MARFSFFTYQEYLFKVVLAWETWGEGFKIRDLDKTMVEERLHSFKDLNARIASLERELEDLRFERDTAVRGIETLAVDLRLSLLVSFAPGSVELLALPHLTDRPAGRPSKHSTAIKAAFAAKRAAKLAQNSPTEGSGSDKP